MGRKGIGGTGFQPVQHRPEACATRAFQVGDIFLKSPAEA